MTDFIKKIKAIIRKIRTVPFTIAVLGPGESHETFWKRKKIREALIEECFETIFPEEIITSFPIIEQELELLNSSKIGYIFILNTSEGPLAELTAFHDKHTIVEKTCLLYPKEFLSPTLPADILGHYWDFIRFSNEEFKSCSITSDCIWKVRARRVMEWSKQSQKLKGLQF